MVTVARTTRRGGRRRLPGRAPSAPTPEPSRAVHAPRVGMSSEGPSDHFPDAGDRRRETFGLFGSPPLSIARCTKVEDPLATRQFRREHQSSPWISISSLLPYSVRLAARVRTAPGVSYLCDYEQRVSV